MRISVTKEYRFEAAHRLMNHPGACKNLHGHSYKLVVTVDRKIDQGTGMAMDFGTLSQIVRERIIDGSSDYPSFDHAVILEQSDPLAEFLLAEFPWFRRILTPGPPTAENLARIFAYIIEDALSAPRWHHASYGLDGYQTRLLKVEVWETSTARATWEAGVDEG